MDNKNTVNILGINISALDKKEVLEKIELFLSDGKQHYIVTPNPEFVLEARKDEEFFYILNNADLAVPDGIGLKFAAWAAGRNIPRITGADLVKDILKIAKEKNLKVAIVNWSRGLSATEDIEKALNKNYPGLRFIIKDVDKNIQNSKFQIPDSDFKPDILFCALGAPWQEKFIYHNLKNMPSIKLAIGVGGAFDFLTGKIRRAPKIMRFVGLEWLWRLFKQPRRWRRIFNAVVVFPWKFIKWRFVFPFLYRPNVACLLYKKENGKFKILLVERSDEPGHWQLPQGGTDGDGAEKAAARELSEELGTNKFEIKGVYKNLWKYRFGQNKKTKKILGYKGQKQSLAIAEFTGKDEDIKINFWDHRNWKWADAEDLVNEVHPVRKQAAKVFLEKFNNMRITNQE